MIGVGKEIRELDKARSEYMKKVMDEYDEEHYAKKRALQAQCINHNFKFSHFGPLWHSWYYCTICGKSLVEDPK